MWEFETSLETDAEPAGIWALWTDVEGWPRWHPGIVQASLGGPFEPGARGSSRAPDGPPSTLSIASVEPGRPFVSETVMRFVRLRFDHRVEPTEGGGARITYRVQMTGPGTPVFRRIIAPRLEWRMPEALRSLAELEQSGR